MTGSYPEDMETTPTLYDFDFSTLQWSKATVTDAALQFRASFAAATCHCGAFLAMGGNACQGLYLTARYDMLLQGLTLLNQNKSA